MNNDFDFEFFSKYINDDKITDLNYNGATLWIDHLLKGRYQEQINISEKELEKFCYKLANYTNQQFNNSHPILESETDQLRISIIHKSVAASGYSISIRKSPPLMRLNKKLLLKQNYAPLKLLDFLESIVKSRSNIMVSGLPGVGKTELVKFLTTFINCNQRVITIEDSLEIRYSHIHPQKDSVMLKVNSHMDYRLAIKASLRQRPDWLLLSEVRGDEVVELLQAVSTGANLISTIHSDEAKDIPKRILHMFPGNEITNERLLYNICERLDYGIHIKSKIDQDGIMRFINEVCHFYVKDNMYHCEIIYTHQDGFIKGFNF